MATLRFISLMSLIAICYLWPAGFLHGQDLQFDRYTMEEGLSHPGNFFRETILQDQNGFIWVSTLNGLNRFDGRTFKTYFFDGNQPQGLPSNLLAGIEEAADGKIWIGTSTGISIFDPQEGTFSNLRHDPMLPSSLPSNRINFIRKDHQGHMWIGTQDRGIARYDPETGVFDDFGAYFNSGLVFFQQKNGTIWLGDFEGLHQYLPDQNMFKTIPMPMVAGEARIQSTADICELKNGNLLINSTFSGLWEFDPKTESFTDISTVFSKANLTSPSCILCARDGTAWLGGLGELYRYKSGIGITQSYQYDSEDPNSLPLLSIIDMYEDQAGSLWLNIIGEGLRVAHQVNLPYQALGDFQLIEALPWKDQKVIMNTTDGLKLFDPLLQSFESLNIPESVHPVRTRGLILSPDQQHLFLRSPNQDTVYQWDFTNQQLTKLPHRGHLDQDLKGRLWIELWYFDEDQQEWIDFKPELKAAFPKLSTLDFFAYDLYFNDENTIWVTTAKGMLNYNRQTKEGTHYPFYSQRPEVNVEVYQIFAGTEGRFYCYTSNGFVLFDPSQKRFIHLLEKDGLLHNQTHAMVEDSKGDLWIGGPKGLQKLDTEDYTFTNYGQGEGLPQGTILHQTPFQDSLGFLYFTIDEKSLRFHPDSLKPVGDTARVQLLDFYLNHQVVQIKDSTQILLQPLAYTQQLNLSYEQVDFGFSFVMPVYNQAKRVQYEYQLSPFQENWQRLSSDNQVHYTNINPGRYTFKVRAQTVNGLASPNVATVEVLIQPPWWKTNLAYLAYACFVIGLAYGIFRYYLFRKLEKVEQQRQQELADLKSKLYTNITHEFRTPLTVIMGITDNIKGFEQERTLIQRNSKNLLRLVNQLLDLAQLDADQFKLDQIQADIVQYLQYLTESFYSMAEEKKIRLTFYPEVKQLLMDYDEVRIQHIIYNLLSNALKFTDQGGKVILHLNKIEVQQVSYLKIKVSDTGKGISNVDLPLIFDRFYQATDSSANRPVGTGIGLALTKEFVEMMGGRITVESQVGVGTDFLILLPIRQTAPSGSSMTREVKSIDAPLGNKKSVVPKSEALTAKHPAEVPLVLIIEDNVDVITYIKGILAPYYSLATAVNGAEGIKTAFEIIPDLIISDVMMPQKDGVEVVATLKQDDRTSHIPMVLLTAKTRPEDKVKGLEAGADAYLIKPFNQEELLVRLRKLLEIRTRLQEKYSASMASKPTPFSTKESTFLQKLQDLVFSRIDDTSLTVKDLEAAVNLGNMQLNRKLKALTNNTPSTFIRSIRLQKAQELLQTTDLNISEIAYEVGFSDPGYFARIFSKKMGASPTEFRNNKRG